ncbi:hypothetical protein E3T43_12725 [Cryobacterium sp. Hh7]|uniref:hypothetical protein n=1 Tax=Cryobacterium sp. Hh7 TaxID=1259159 RepID=UPI00106AF02E|nr:hypothetical protein [Cryobacterium sp. Hh7]TFD54642.1 hypothetical protein E3T43_12725 [Cryobacterium sp. Hh7]
MRRRLIAAGSTTTLVVKTEWRSGSLNTTGHTAALGTRSAPSPARPPHPPAVPDATASSKNSGRGSSPTRPTPPNWRSQGRPAFGLAGEGRVDTQPDETCTVTRYADSNA